MSNNPNGSNTAKQSQQCFPCPDCSTMVPSALILKHIKEQCPKYELEYLKDIVRLCRLVPKDRLRFIGEELQEGCRFIYQKIAGGVCTDTQEKAQSNLIVNSSNSSQLVNGHQTTHSHRQSPNSTIPNRVDSHKPTQLQTQKDKQTLKGDNISIVVIPPQRDTIKSPQKDTMKQQTTKQSQVTTKTTQQTKPAIANQSKLQVPRLNRQAPKLSIKPPRQLCLSCHQPSIDGQYLFVDPCFHLICKLCGKKAIKMSQKDNGAASKSDTPNQAQCPVKHCQFRIGRHLYPDILGEEGFKKWEEELLRKALGLQVDMEEEEQQSVSKSNGDASSSRPKTPTTNDPKLPISPSRQSKPQLVACITCRNSFIFTQGLPTETPKTVNGITVNPTTYSHYAKYRLLCSFCKTQQCRKCGAHSYHLNMTCQEYQLDKKIPKCRYCRNKLEKGYSSPLGIKAFNDVCASEGCLDLARKACSKKLKCGHFCYGVMRESQCPPCLEVGCKDNITLNSPQKQAIQFKMSDSRSRTKFEASAINKQSLCSICGSQPLQAKPCIVSLSCNHIFHEDCLSKRLFGRWDGRMEERKEEVDDKSNKGSTRTDRTDRSSSSRVESRSNSSQLKDSQIVTTVSTIRSPISFEFCCCPLCRKWLRLPTKSIQATLDGYQKMKNNLEDLLRERLKSQKDQSHPKILDASSPYYQKPLLYAEAAYAFYECSKCQVFYYGGKKSCHESREATIDSDSKESALLCFKCTAKAHQSQQWPPRSVVGGSQTKRGSSSTRGNPQARDTALSSSALIGNNCPVHGSQFITYKCKFCCSVANRFCWGHTHFCEQCHIKQSRGDAVSKLTKQQLPKCRPTMCPLKGKHPPNGEEYLIGCIVCVLDVVHTKD